MQLNYDRIDRQTLYRGGGYIIENGDITKSFATHYSQPGAQLPPSPHTTLKNIVKMICMLILVT